MRLSRGKDRWAALSVDVIGWLALLVALVLGESLTGAVIAVMLFARWGLAAWASAANSRTRRSIPPGSERSPR